MRNNKPAAVNDGVFVRTDNFLQKVKYDDIHWIEAFGNYCLLFTDTGKHTLHTTLKNIEDKLPVERFARIHRSFIVNIFKINFINGKSLKVEGNFIPVSRSCKKLLMNKLYCM